MVSNEKGFLYIATGRRYLMEAQQSVISLKKFTKYSACMVTDDAEFNDPNFDKIIVEDLPKDFISKIIGMRLTPFKQTVYLDNDTFVCSDIDEMFSVLDCFDMSMMPDPALHSHSFFKKYLPAHVLKYENIIPEYHLGVVVFQMSEVVKNLFADWLQTHKRMNIKSDASSFRETYLTHCKYVRVAPLPSNYNYHGIKSFGFAYGEIKIIHERLGEKWNTLTTVMLPNKKMEKFAKKINRLDCKRIIVPYLGVIPYTYSPYRLKYKIKKLFRIKLTRKADTF